MTGPLALIGVLCGGLLLAAALLGLFFNEVIALDEERALTAGGRVVITVSSDRVDPANEGRLVHMTGEATTDDVMVDDAYPTVAARALFLARDVEIYQWQETRHKDSKGRAWYSHEKVWSKEPIDSSGFRFANNQRPVNTGTLPRPSRERWAATVTVGAFTLPPELVKAIAEPEKLDAQAAEASPDAPRVADGYIYLGRNPAEPAIGDVRIGFRIVRPQIVSVFAKQTGSSLGPYGPPSTTIMGIVAGPRSAAQMIAHQQSRNASEAWVLRVFGFLVAFLALRLIAGSLSRVTAGVPVVGRVLEAGLWVAALGAAVALSLTSIAGGWLLFRPLIAAPMLVAAVFVVVWLVRRGARAPATA